MPGPWHVSNLVDLRGHPVVRGCTPGAVRPGRHSFRDHQQVVPRLTQTIASEDRRVVACGPGRRASFSERRNLGRRSLRKLPHERDAAANSAAAPTAATSQTPLAVASSKRPSTATRLARPRPGKLALVHRLSRTKYQNAVRDLLGIDTLPKEID